MGSGSSGGSTPTVLRHATSAPGSPGSEIWNSPNAQSPTSQKSSESPYITLNEEQSPSERRLEKRKNLEAIEIIDSFPVSDMSKLRLRRLSDEFSELERPESRMSDGDILSETAPIMQNVHLSSA